MSAALDLFAGKRRGLRSATWLLLVLGTLGSIVATLTGLAAHLSYKDNARLHSPIERHQSLAFATMGFFVVLTAWRWRTLRNGGTDLGATRAYFVLVLAVTGLLGGDPLLEWGVGVKGITR